MDPQGEHELPSGEKKEGKGEEPLGLFLALLRNNGAVLLACVVYTHFVNPKLCTTPLDPTRWKWKIVSRASLCK